jgi:hypothetical protein
MARTITIRRTVTGPTNTFSSDFDVVGAATLTVEETVTNSHVLATPLVIKLPIPNDATAEPIKGVLFGATGDIDSITFTDGASQIGTVDIATIEDADSAYFWPAETGQAAPDSFDNNTDIAEVEVYQDGAQGNITLYGLVIYDPTF